MTWMRNMMLTTRACVAKLNWLFGEIEDSKELYQTIEKTENSFCGRIKLTNNRWISLSVPPDASGNNEAYKDYSPTTFEIALWDNKHHEIMYDESIGYYDINRYDSIEGLVEEIQRLSE